MKNRILLFLLLFTPSFFIASSNHQHTTTNLLFQLISSIRENNYERFKEIIDTGIDITQHYNECDYAKWARSRSAYEEPLDAIRSLTEKYKHIKRLQDCKIRPERTIAFDIHDFQTNNLWWKLPWNVPHDIRDNLFFKVHGETMLSADGYTEDFLNLLEKQHEAYDYIATLINTFELENRSLK